MSIALACIALAAATLVFIFFLEPERGEEVAHRTKLDQLLERREAIYENLRDLKFEHRAGKFSEADYLEMKRAMENEAALVLAEIESVTGGAASPAARLAAYEARKQKA